LLAKDKENNMNEQVERKEAMELTFHSCLLQVLQNRTEELSKMPKWYIQDVKQKGNLFKQSIDKKLTQLYGSCNEEEVDQAMELINLIADKIDECWDEYVEDFKQGKI
jgi:hypothetical protein